MSNSHNTPSSASALRKDSAEDNRLHEQQNSPLSSAKLSRREFLAWCAIGTVGAVQIGITSYMLMEAKSRSKLAYWASDETMTLRENEDWWDRMYVPVAEKYGISSSYVKKASDEINSKDNPRLRPKPGDTKIVPAFNKEPVADVTLDVDEKSAVDGKEGEREGDQR
jgi:hypothetical protein